jgi:DDE superfamily endonuclease
MPGLPPPRHIPTLPLSFIRPPLAIGDEARTAPAGSARNEWKSATGGSPASVKTRDPISPQSCPAGSVLGALTALKIAAMADERPIAVVRRVMRAWPLDDIDRIDCLFLRTFAGGQPHDRQSVRRRDFLGDLFALAQRLHRLAHSPKLPVPSGPYFKVRSCRRDLHQTLLRGFSWNDAHALLFLDQAGWHVSTRLPVPDNITLSPLPPKSPELNPVEIIWQFMRGNWLSNRIFKSYDDILDHCCFAWNKLIDMPWKIISIGTREWAYRS